MLTVSATPGYLPYMPHGETWSPRIDLYQLGLTLLQAAAGNEYTGDNLDDLRLMAGSRCSRETLNLLNGLATAHEGGFQTSYTAHRAARNAIETIGR